MDQMTNFDLMTDQGLNGWVGATDLYSAIFSQDMAASRA